MTTYTATPVDRMGKPIGESVTFEVAAPDVERDADAVPDPDTTSVPSLIAWVDYDPDRAKAALAVELARDPDSQRKTAIDQLTKLAAGANPGDT